MATTRRKRAAGRPAGDSQQLVRAVLAATFRQLGASGFAGLSVEAVAREAGINKTSVYRRWPNKTELVLAALQEVRTQEPPFEESGDLRRDLTSLLQRKANALVSPRGKKLARALLVLDAGPEADAMMQALRARQDALLSQILERAVARGELPQGAASPALLELLIAPLTYHTLVLDLPVDERYVPELVEHFLKGLGVIEQPGPLAE
jgi:AcrR family transcriptional regulator